MNVVLICFRFFIVVLLELYGTPAFSQNNYSGQIDSIIRQIMPPSVNCERAQVLLHCELLLPSFELSISIHSDGTADIHFKGTKQEIETNLFRARLLFDRIFKISREQIDKCIYPLIPSGYNRDVVLGQPRYKLNCTGAQTPDGTYSADIHRAIQE